MLSQKSLDSITLIMLLLILLLIPTGLTELFLGGAVFSRLNDWVQSAISLLFGLTVVLIIVVLVLENDDPVHTLAWILVLLYIPLAGFIIYLFFGRNWRKTRLFNRKGLADVVHLEELRSDRQPDWESCPMSDLQRKLCCLLQNNSKALLTCDNKVDIISDTNAGLEQICAAIEAAKKHIHLEYFSIGRDSAGKRMKELLTRKARQGVEIRFIYDDVGCWNLGPRFKREMREAGIQFVPFMPVWVPILNSRLNYRNHRKLVIVDGEAGFLGGLNIGDKYLGKSRYFGYWRDSLVRLEGESVISLQAIFLVDWFFVSKQNLLRPGVFENYVIEWANCQSDRAKTPVQLAASGPDSDHASILQVYFSAISNARRSIRITSPYLILNSSLLMALKTAALSGVKVQIILPCKQDHFIVWWGSKSYYRELLETGIEIYEYQPGFIHAKVLIVDGEAISIGTANMDLRSFNQNFEITALIYDAKTVVQAVRHFEIDLNQSRRVELHEFLKRSVLKKGMESVCRLFSPLL